MPLVNSNFVYKADGMGIDGIWYNELGSELNSSLMVKIKSTVDTRAMLDLQGYTHWLGYTIQPRPQGRTADVL